MITLEHKQAILADLYLNYQEEMRKTNWEEFFEQNDVGLPLATLTLLDLAELPRAEDKRFYAETLIKQSFADFCKRLQLDPDGDYTTARSMFERSPNQRTSERDEEDL